MTDTPKPQLPPPLKLRFNRRITQLDNLQAISAEIKERSMISGNAMRMIVNDLIKLRVLCMSLKEAYKKGNEDDVHGLLQKLEMIV